MSNYFAFLIFLYPYIFLFYLFFSFPIFPLFLIFLFFFSSYLLYLYFLHDLFPFFLLGFLLYYFLLFSFLFLSLSLIYIFSVVIYFIFLLNFLFYYFLLISRTLLYGSFPNTIHIIHTLNCTLLFFLFPTLKATFTPYFRFLCMALISVYFSRQTITDSHFLVFLLTTDIYTW